MSVVSRQLSIAVIKKDYFFVILININWDIGIQRTNFENLRVYQLSEQLADAIWDMVVQWGFFARDTVGKQLVKSVDSIGANMAEGTGRGSSGDNKRFAKIARGSMFEVKHWLRRAYKRKLINEDQTQCLKVLIDELSPKLSAYINSIGLK